MKNFIFLILILYMSACSSLDFTAISTRDIRAKNLDLTKLPQRYVEVSECRLGRAPAEFTRLVDKTLEEGEGDLLLDAKYYPHTQVYWTWFTGHTCSSLEGLVVNTKGDD